MTIRPLMQATRRMALVALAMLAATAAAHARPDAVFGPSPRALDNHAVFAPDRLPQWRQLRDAGVGAIVLNATFVAPTDMDGPAPRARPQDTYMTDAELRDLAGISEGAGLDVIYEAGIALGHDLCSNGMAPRDIGETAARREYDAVISRLHRAGVSIATLSFDGPFLRLVSDSSKRGACAVDTGYGLSVPDAVEAGRTYMLTLRALVERSNPRGGAVTATLIVNLPNWQVLNLPRTANVGGPRTVDLRDVMAAFTEAQDTALRRGEAQLIIDEIVVDYPWAMVDNGRDLFRDRVRHLWNMTRTINAAGPAPTIGFIVNTLPYTQSCAFEVPNAVPFLPWQRDGKMLADTCISAQMGLNDTDPRPDTDRDFMAESVAYARALAPGGALDRVLTTADGTRITDHLTHIYFQSWGENPVFNVWYMDEVADYLRTRY